MTREEAIKEIQDASDYEVRHGDVEHHHEEIMRRVEAFEQAVNELQKEPCEDAVSRKEVNKLYDEYRPRLATHVSEFGDKLKSLPPVTPTRKKGKWIKIAETGEIVCETCNYSAVFKSTFCPNCGAEMEGV